MTDPTQHYAETQHYTDNPNRRFSAARVAIWGLGIITLVTVGLCGLLALSQIPIPAPLPAVATTGMGGLTMAAGAASMSKH